MRVKSNVYSLIFKACIAVLSTSQANLNAWSEPASISDSTSSVNPTPSCLCIDQNSNSLVGWLSGNVGTDTGLLTSSLAAGAPLWNTPVSLYTGVSPDFPSFPIIFADNDGNANAIWSNFHQTGEVFDQTTVLTTTQALLETSWPDPISSGTLTGFPNGGGAGVDELGNRIGIIGLAADSSTYTPPYSIQFITFAAEATEWSTPIELGVDNGSPGPVIFASASQGEGVIGWKIDSPLSFKTARYSFVSDELQPINDIPLPAGIANIGFVRSTLAKNGDTIIVFGAQVGTGTNYLIYSSFLPAGSSYWSFPEVVSNPANNTTGAVLSIGSSKDAHSVILWGELTPSGNAFIRAANLSFGGELTNITDLTDPDPAINNVADYSSSALINVDQYGNAAAIWQLLIEGTTPTVQVSSLPVGGEWSDSYDLSGSGTMPKVALSDQGSAVAVWIDTVSNLLTGSFENYLFPLSAPTGFAGYLVENVDDYTLNMHWSPSLAPNIVNYEVYRGEELVATIPSEGPYQFSDSVVCKYAPLNYNLVAVASNGNKSDPLAIVITP